MNNTIESGRSQIDSLKLARIKEHMAGVVPNGLTVDLREGDKELWSHIHTLFVPLRPKHILGKENLPLDPSAKKALQRLQKEWGTRGDGFPAMIFTPRGTKEFNIEWAMVRPEDFEKTPEELVSEIKQIQERHMVLDNDHRVRSLEFVYTAVTGERPPGSDAKTSLKELPTGSIF